MPLEPEPDGPALAAEEGQTLLQRLGHWCRVQPNKVNKRQRRVAINRSANESDEYLINYNHFLLSPSQRLFTFLDDQGREVDSLTYKVCMCTHKHKFGRQQSTATVVDQPIDRFMDVRPFRPLPTIRCKTASAGPGHGRCPGAAEVRGRITLNRLC